MDFFNSITLIVFLPTIGALALAFFPSLKDEEGVNEAENKNLLLIATLAITLITFAVTVGVFLLSGDARFHSNTADMQKAFSVDWIPAFDIHFAMGLDGISFPLIMLTTGISVLAVGASWSIKKHLKAYCILFLLLETGMLGVFLALDFFLFYVFLGSHAAADVFLDWHLGWAPARIRSNQVFPLYTTW